MANSQFMKQRHKEAREKKKLYEEFYPEEEKKPYSYFLREKTFIDEQIVAYQVSYQVSYRGDIGGIFISPKTFIVYGIAGQENEIYNRTMNMILGAEGNKTGNQLPVGTQEAISRGAEIKVFPRGMEESFKRPKVSQYEQVFEKNFHVENLDSVVEMKNHKNRKGELELDIRHFL